MKAILAVAVLAMAAFAGVMMVGDDADAAGEEDTTIYSVTYVTDVGTFKIPADASNKITLMDNTAAAARGITKTNYTIVGWNVTDAGVTQTYSGEITLSKDISVTPSWKLDTSKSSVIFLADGKIIGTEQFFDTENEAVTIPGAPEKEGYIFVKYVDETGEDAPASIVSPKPGSSVTYKAVYAQVFDVTFMLNGAAIGEPVQSNDLVDDGVLVQVKVPSAPIMDNHLFMGWADKSGKVIISYSADATPEYALVKDYVFSENTTLYAKFVPVTFTVTFVYGEDRAVFATETVKYGDLAIEPKGLPEGYKGWDWNFGVPIEADTEIPAIEADPVTVYTVTFEIDGKAPVTQRSDSMVLPDTTIEGKVFQGWVVKGESQYVSPMNYAITGDITFVAVYKEADPPAGPSFFQTTEGKCVAVLIAVVIIAFIYAVYSNMFGLKDALTSVKITRVKK